MIILEISVDILVVGTHIHEAVTREVEEDGLLLPRHLALQSLADGSGDGMAGLRSRDDALAAGEEGSGLERLELVDVYGLHVTILHELGHEDTGSMVTEPAGMDICRLEVMAEGVHRQERSVSGFVAEIVLELSAGQLRAGRRLGRDEAHLLRALLKLMAEERIGYSAEIRTSSEAGNDHVRLLSGELHLFFGLETDDGLMQADMIEHGTEGIFAIRGSSGQFDGLGDGTAQRTAVIRINREDVLAGTRAHGRRRCHVRPEGLHDGTPVWLLLEADLDHVDGALEAVHLGRERKGAAPLSRSGLGGDVGHALLFAEIGLGEG